MNKSPTINKKKALAIAISLATPAIAQGNIASTIESINALQAKSAYQINDVIILSELQKKVMTKDITYQSYYALLSELDDVENDSTLEAPAMRASITGYTPPTNGGFIPASSIAPKTDGYGMPIGYCSWDHGSSNTSADRITGLTTPANTDIVFAVMSSGPNRTFDTACSDASSGTLVGDDTMIAVTLGQANLGIASSQNEHFKPPVADKATLLGLDTSSSQPGELRVVLEDGMTYAWLDLDGDGTYQWEAVSSYFYSGDSNGATAGGEYTTNPYNVGIGTKFSDKTLTPGSELEVDGQVRIVSGTGMVDNDTNAQLHIGSQEAAAGTIGESSRVAIQPYGHTGGPWSMVARDDTSRAYLDFRYGPVAASDSVMTFKAIPAGSGRVGIGSDNPPTRLSIGGPDDSLMGPVLSLHGDAVNQFESGRIRMSESDATYLGGFIHYDGTFSNGSDGALHIGVNNAAGQSIADDVNVISLLRNNGNVGINTPAPLSDLHIKSKLDGTSGNAELILEADQDDNFESDNPLITLIQDGRQVEGVFGLNGVADANYNGALANATYIESARPGGGGIQFVVNRDPTFAGSLGNSAMTITSAGNVGIGTQAPQDKLQIIDGSVRLQGDNNYVGYYAFRAKPATSTDDDADGYENVALGVQSYNGMGHVSSTYGITFIPNIDVTNTRAMTILEDGKVGIGTETPTDALDVEGAAKIGVYSTVYDGIMEGEGDIQKSGLLSGLGFVTTPWMYTRAIESDNRGTSATLISLGEGTGYTSKDEIAFVTSGISAAKFDRDGNFISERGGIEIAGTSGTRISPALRINAQNAISLEDNKHHITYNDGAGNFNIRVGNKYDENNNTVITEPGHAFQTVWDQSGGDITWRISQNGSVGNLASWQGWMTLKRSDLVFKNGMQVNASAYNFNGYQTYSGNHYDTGGSAAIVNDNGSYKALMIMGNRSAGGKRMVKVWDNLWVDENVSAASFTTRSDRRLKRDIRNIQDPLEKLSKINGVNYYWRRNEFPELHLSDRRQAGVIAQELESIMPEAVRTGTDGFKTVKYDNIIPLLIEAGKELDERIDKLEETVQSHDRTLKDHDIKLNSNSSKIERYSKIIDRQERMIISLKDFIASNGSKKLDSYNFKNIELNDAEGPSGNDIGDDADAILQKANRSGAVVKHELSRFYQ